FFSYDIKAKALKDHGAIAGYRTFETPRHAEDLNRGSGDNVRYSRQVSRAIAVMTDAVLTGGADGYLYSYDPLTKALRKTKLRLPSARGRESWASLDVAVRTGIGAEIILGGTSDGYVFILRPKGDLDYLGKPFAAGAFQGLVTPLPQDPLGVVGPASS